MTKKYSLQQYMYDDLVKRQLQERLKVLTNEYRMCRWVIAAVEETTASLTIISERMRRYELKPGNRGDDE
jgi:hypothetical protein